MSLIIGANGQADLKEPTVDDEVKGWSLLIGRLRKLKYLPTDIHRIVDEHRDREALAKAEEAEKVEKSVEGLLTPKVIV